ncbi:MAG: hypothetical protein FWE32_04205 [Oscillospiraceae bacterium]|nr:hypothetical protein [Oscillospiraceae bacterium]
MLINMNQLMERRAALRHYPYLPLFYALPQPLVVARKMDKFPRNPFVAISDPKWRKLYHTLGWQAEVADLWAITVWPYLGIRGGMSNYSIRDPFVLLMYSLPLWSALLAAIGINLDNLAGCPDNGEMAYLTEAQTDQLCESMAKMFWHDPYTKAQAILEIVKEHRAHEDFADRKSTVRIDFHRRYYHTRTKNKHLQLDDVLEEAEYVPDIDTDMDNVIATGWIRNFYRWLGNKRDIDICKLRYMGYTHEQIADHLGYKNPSGVTKRLKVIADILEVYVEWQRELEQDNNAPPPLKLLKRNAYAYQPKGKPRAKELRYISIPFEYQPKAF